MLRSFGSQSETSLVRFHRSLLQSDMEFQMSFDYQDSLNTHELWYEKQGVKNSPQTREPKPYIHNRAQAYTTFGGDARYNYGQFDRLFGNSFYSPESRYATLNNLHFRRVRGKIEGIQHFTEALVEFRGLKRQLWSLLHQGLRTIARRRGGFIAKDVFSRGTWKQTPELYLLWQFAIAPLVNQINDTLEKISEIGGEKYGRVTTFADYSSEYDVGTRNAPYFLDYKEVKIRLTTVFKSTVNNSKTGFIKEFLGLNRPLTVLWDLKGWSWAVDYFFNLGELLANLDGDSLTRSVIYLSNSRSASGSAYRWEHLPDLISSDPVKQDRQLVALRKKYGDIRPLRGENGKWYAVRGFKPKVADIWLFERKVGVPPTGFLPEFKFKPKPGTFQFANLASAIAISLRSFEWSDKNFLIKPHKR